MDIKFSVIIPTYRRNFFLKRAIDKTIKQKKKPIEVIIIDDNCDNETEYIVNKYNNSTDIDIIYLKNKKKVGAIISRNKGVKISKGNYIAFLDDDDFWNKDYLNNIEKKIISLKADFYLSNFYKFKKINRPYANISIPEKFKIEDYLFSNPGAICSNVVIKKSVFKSLKGFDSKISGSADKDLFIRANLNRYKCIIVKERNMFYQIHKNQWSKNNKLILKQKIIFFIKYFNYYLSFNKLYKINKVFALLTFRTLKDIFFKG